MNDEEERTMDKRMKWFLTAWLFSAITLLPLSFTSTTLGSWALDDRSYEPMFRLAMSAVFWNLAIMGIGAISLGVFLIYFMWREND